MSIAALLAYERKYCGSNVKKVLDNRKTFTTFEKYLHLIRNMLY
jgi:hypothetical protein